MMAAAAAALILPLAGCAKYKHIVLETRRIGDYYCSVYEDNTVEITAYKGGEEILDVPEKLDGYTVVGFGTKAFDGCEGLKKVLIPSSVATLPPKLFNGCASLKSVYIPASVSAVGKNVIFDCPEFTEVLYEGTEEQWSKINVGKIPWTDNYVLINAEVSFGCKR